MGVYIGDVFQGAADPANITTATTTNVKVGPGELFSIVINTKGSGSTATVYDSLAASGTKLATIDTASSVATLFYNIKFTLGLTIVTVGTADLTVTYR